LRGEDVRGIFGHAIKRDGKKYVKSRARSISGGTRRGEVARSGKKGPPGPKKTGKRVKENSLEMGRRLQGLTGGPGNKVLQKRAGGKGVRKVV